MNTNAQTAATSSSFVRNFQTNLRRNARNAAVRFRNLFPRLPLLSKAAAGTLKGMQSHPHRKLPKVVQKREPAQAALPRPLEILTEKIPRLGDFFWQKFSFSYCKSPAFSTNFFSLKQIDKDTGTHPYGYHTRRKSDRTEDT